MTINLQKPDITELKPKITVFGVGGGGGNAVNNMIHGGLQGVEFVVANTDAQALTMSAADKVIQLGVDVTEGLGAGSHPEVGRAAAEECLTEIQDYLAGTHMAFVTAGMGGGTGTGAAPVVARAARDLGILTVGVVTKPFQFEGQGRMRTADEGILELQKSVDSMIVIPNQNLFRIANDKTTFADAFGMADQVLYSGVACITDLMVKEGLINLDFADVRSVMKDMGKAMMGTGEATGEGRAMQAAEAAISNPLLDESSMGGARGLLISITGGRDLTLFEVDEAATRIREEVDQNANIILGATFDEDLEGVIRVSVVATGIDSAEALAAKSEEKPAVEMVSRAVRTTPQAASKGDEARQIESRKIAQTEASVEAVRAALEVPMEEEKVQKDGVSIAPFQPKSNLFTNPDIEEEFRTALESELMPENAGFVPPVAEELQSVPAKSAEIPAIDGSKAERAKPVATPAATPVAPQPTQSGNGAMGLLNKLKSSFGNKEEEHQAGLGQSTGAPSMQTSPRASEPVSTVPVQAPAPSPQRRPSEPRVDDNPYAPKKDTLDSTGRINPSSRSQQDDDQLDIPAFLRRQAN